MDGSSIGRKTYEAYRAAGKKAGLLPLVENMRVLEVGFGTGDLLKALREMGNDVYGVDVGHAIIDSAKQTGINNVFLVDVSEEPLPFDDDFFEAVYCYEVIEHLTNPHRFVSEVRRVLKRNGAFFVSVPAQENDMGYGFRRHTFVYPGLFLQENFERFFTQMYFAIEQAIHGGPTDWLVGHNYRFRNVKPADRKDVVEVIIGDYSIPALYGDVLSPEAIKKEIRTELANYERMIATDSHTNPWEVIQCLLAFLLKNYPHEYDTFLRIGEELLRQDKAEWFKAFMKELLAREEVPVPILERLKALIQQHLE